MNPQPMPGEGCSPLVELRAPRALVIDNRDSFVFNLVEELRRRHVEVRTVRNEIHLGDLNECLSRFAPDLVLLSPGPGRPEARGVMIPWLETRPTIPVLGVCLGHQALVVASGGCVGKARRLVHGRASSIRLKPDPLFEGIPSPLVAGRYHSLVATRVPQSMEVIATTTEEGQETVMAVRHRELCQVGLQFHPESILTPYGGEILWRFVQEAALAIASENATPCEVKK
jgi:anthranilate synthase component 2